MPDKPSNNPGRFWQELKRRKVIRRNIAYLASSFVILELVSIIADPFGLPPWTLKLVFILLSIGFVISVVLSWYYDFTPEGLERIKSAREAKEVPVEKPSRLFAWKIATYISLVIIAGLLVFNILKGGKSSEYLTDLEKSIAVIPFINDSPDEENAYFINGIMDELIINLQSIKDLKVPGRTSIEQYRNNPKPIPEIAKELGVNYIVEASGQKYGNKFTLRVQLLEGTKGMHLWGESIDRQIESIDDISSIQSGIAISIAEQLKTFISPEEKQLIEKTPTTSLTAYDFYQRGKEEYIKYWLDNDNKDALERAEDLYYKALEYDSTFAKAYTGLAWVYVNKYYWETYLSEDFLDSLLILADIALSFDDQLSEAYVIRGGYYEQNNRREEAIKEYYKALTLNPNEWQAYWQLGELYAPYDDLVKAIDSFHKAIALHRGPFLPEILMRLGVFYTAAGFRDKGFYYASEALGLDNDSAKYFSSLALMENISANFESSIEFGEKSYAIDSTNRWLIFMMGMDYCNLGQYKKCQEYYKKLEGNAITLDRSEFLAILRTGHAYWVNGFEEEAESYFNKGLELYNEVIELDRNLKSTIETYYCLAAYYAFRGMRDKAYENLRLFNQVPRMPYYVIKDLTYEPLFDNIRDEPEFQQILKDVKIKYQLQHEEVRQWMKENDM